MRVRVLYFAGLRDAAGRGDEMLEIQAMSFATFYEELRVRHALTMPRERLRVARNGEFADWTDSANDGDEIAFIPPVSGG
jgi:molybdopterin synthase sulfur carrier subunit